MCVWVSVCLSVWESEVRGFICVHASVRLFVFGACVRASHLDDVVHVVSQQVALQVTRGPMHVLRLKRAQVAAEAQNTGPLAGLT